MVLVQTVGWINNIYSFSWFFFPSTIPTYSVSEDLLLSIVKRWQESLFKFRINMNTPVAKWVGVIAHGVHSTTLDICFSCSIHCWANNSGSVKEHRYFEHYCNALLFHYEFSFLNMEVGLSLSSSLLCFGIGPLCSFYYVYKLHFEIRIPL